MEKRCYEIERLLKLLASFQIFSPKQEFDRLFLRTCREPCLDQLDGREPSSSRYKPGKEPEQGKIPNGRSQRKKGVAECGPDEHQDKKDLGREEINRPRVDELPRRVGKGADAEDEPCVSGTKAHASINYNGGQCGCENGDIDHDDDIAAKQHREHESIDGVPFEAAARGGLRLLLGNQEEGGRGEC